MTPKNFCYWLQGIFEIQQAGVDRNMKVVPKLTDAQIEMIQTHLGYVFNSQVTIKHSPPLDPPSDLVKRSPGGTIGASFC